MFGKKQKENQIDDTNGEAESVSSFSIIPETKTEDNTENNESGFSIKRSEIADKETENLHDFKIIPDSNSEEPDEKKRGFFKKRDKDVEKVGDVEERTDFEIKPEKEKKKGKRFGKKSREIEPGEEPEEEQSPRGRKKKGRFGLKGKGKKSKGGILSGRKKYDNPEDNEESDDDEEEFHSLPEYDYREIGPLVFPKHDPGDTILESYWIDPGLSRVSIVRTQDYENVYITHEPALTEFEKYLLERLHSGVRDLLIIKEIRVEDKTKTLYEAIDILIESYKLDEELEPETIYKIRYYLKRSFFGWGRIDPLRGDTEIEDISCDGYDSHVFLYHRKYRDMRTIIKFKDPRELDSLVALFAQKSGKHISLANPIVDATLPEGSRIQLTYGTVVGSHGSSFTIRKFKKDPFSPIDLIINGTFTVEEIVYMWMAVENNHSVLIIGGTASGKTTTLNAMAQFIPALSKVVTIEDTREINLDHENWIASIVPPSSSSLEESKHDITMFDLLKAAMRQRPEYILVGEVRGVETQTLFQAMNTGHTTFSTLHAGDVVAAINRLQNPPLDVPKATIETLDVVISQARMFRNGKQVRRCNEIVEIVGLTETGDLEINQVYSYNPDTDKPVFSGFSDVYATIAKKTNRNKSDFDEEIDVRKTIISSMLRQEIHDYREVARIVWLYLSRRDYVIENIDNLMPLLKKNNGNTEVETPKAKMNESENSDINKYYQNLVEDGKTAEEGVRTSLVTPVIIDEESEPEEVHEEVSKEIEPEAEKPKEEVNESEEPDTSMAYRFNEETGRWETTAPKVIQETNYDSKEPEKVDEVIPETEEPEVEAEPEKVDEVIPETEEPEVVEEPEKVDDVIPETEEPEVVEEPEKVDDVIPEIEEPEVVEEPEKVNEIIPEIEEPEIEEEPEKVDEVIPETEEPEIEEEPETVDEIIPETEEPEIEEEPETVDEVVPETEEPEIEEEPEKVDEVIPEIEEPEVEEEPETFEELVPETEEPEVEEEPETFEELVPETEEPEVEEEPEKAEEIIPEIEEPEAEEEPETVEEIIHETEEPEVEEEPEKAEEIIPEIEEPEAEEEPETVDEVVPETEEPETVDEVVPEIEEPEVEEEPEKAEEIIPEIEEPEVVEEPVKVDKIIPEIEEPEFEEEPEKIDEVISETKEPIKETPKPQPREEEYSIYDDPSAFEEDEPDPIKETPKEQPKIEEEEPEPVKEIPKEQPKVEEKIEEAIQEPEEETDDLFEIDVPLPSDEDRYGIKSKPNVLETSDDDFFEIGGSSETKNYGSTFDLYADESDDSSKK